MSDNTEGLAWTPPNDKRSWLSAAEAEKLYEPKGYPRGEVDYRIRTENEYPSTPEMLAIRLGSDQKLDDKKRELEAEAKPQYVVEPGHEVDAASAHQKTKDGAWKQQSTAGKLLTVLEDIGVEYKVGESTYFTGDKVVPINIKKEGRQTPVTIGHKIKPGTQEVHRWIDFPFRGRRATLVGSTVTWGGKEYSWDEFKEEILNG